MPRKYAAIFAVALCLANSTATRGDAGPVVQWLINQKATLFDFGMLSLQIELGKWETGWFKFNQEMNTEFGVFPVYSVSYDFDKNRINVFGTLINTKQIEPLNAAKQTCKKILDHISGLAYVDPETGKFYTALNIKHSALSVHFAHAGYAIETPPDDYLSKLDQIFVLNARVNGATFEPTDCHRPLLSNKVYFEE